QRLLDAGYEPQLHRLKALGYREIAAYLHGQQSLEAALDATKQHHRRYAKRQLTWFRADERVLWMCPSRANYEMVLAALQPRSAVPE
ncbi:MAG: tRNA (adenosine(37)-N6)-dimethylallyltransferase MiaA, partial [Candidatus Hydrogenedentes bacterium]|nr:tRNA (adenosine(37)-N6)-dimethylallyltransferase MiaA [Candidatus Hydrogenedentota bacterium]